MRFFPITLLSILALMHPGNVAIGQPQAAVPAESAASFRQPTTTVLLPAEPLGDGSYQVIYGTEHGISEQYELARVYARHDPERPLDDYEIGEAEIEIVGEEATLLSNAVFEDYTPSDDETVLVALAMATPNSAYLSVPYRFFTNGITLTDIEDETLIDLNSFVDDGLYMEYVALGVLRQDVVSTATTMRDIMEEPIVEGGRHDGEGLFQAMESSSVSDIRSFLRVRDGIRRYLHGPHMALLGDIRNMVGCWNGVI